MKRKSKIKRTRTEVAFDSINLIFLVGFALITAYPLWFCLVNSFNDGLDAMKGGIYLWPRIFSLENYKVVFQDGSIMRAMGVSILRVLIGTPLHILITALAAYALSKSNLIGKKLYMVLGTVTMFFSGGLIPTFLNIRNLGLYDSFWVFILPSIFSFYDCLIFISFFKGLPNGLEEAAMIDGAGAFCIFFRIVLPLSMPVVATIALFSAVGHWNDYFSGVIYIRSDELIPIQTYLYRVIAQSGGAGMIERARMGVAGGTTVLTQSLRYATMVVSILPIICTYPFLQKYFVKGITLGAVKG